MEGINNTERINITRRAFEDTSLENPLNKIQLIRSQYHSKLEKTIQFGGDQSSIIFFSEDVNSNEERVAHFIEYFSRIVIWNGNLMIPSEKVDYFWGELRKLDGKTLGEVLDRTEELLNEIKNEVNSDNL